MAEQLKIVIDADVNRAISGLEKLKEEQRLLNDEIADFKQALRQTDSAIASKTRELAGLSKGSSTYRSEAARLNKELDELRTKSATLSSGLRASKTELLGVSTGVKDLTREASRLRNVNETGAVALARFTSVNALAGQALNNLRGQVISFATAAVTGMAGGLLISAIPALASFVLGLGKTSKEAKEAQERIKALASSVANDLVKLTTLVGVITNVNTSVGDQQKALAALNQEYADSAFILDKQKVTLDNINEAYKAITESILNQAIVKGAQEEIAKIVEVHAQKILSLRLAKERERIEDEKKIKVNQTLLTEEQKIQRRLDARNGIVRDGAILQAENRQEVVKTIAELNNYDAALARVKQEMFDALAPLLNLTSEFSDLGVTLNKEKKKIETAFVLEPMLFRAKLFVADPEEEVQKFFKGVKIIPNFAPPTKQDIDKFNKLFDQPRKLNFETVVESGFAINGIQVLNNLTDAAKESALVIENTLTPAFTGMFDAILAGQSPLKAFFNGIIQSINQVIKRLIAAAIQAAILSSLSGGSTKFIDAFRGLLGFRAQGGPVNRGSPYVVGEDGPEVFVPNMSGNIIPNNSMSSLGMGLTGRGMQAVHVTIDGQISGDKILFVQQRAEKSQRRGINGSA